LFFEGSEKKAEVIVDNKQISLLHQLNDGFWHRLVGKSQAQIISQISNNQCKAFILSESSLFVWEDRFIILTCGITRLVNAVEFFIREIGLDKISYLSYQRKNEYFAHAQPSCFGDDILVLNRYLPGRAYRFGDIDSHHSYLFHQENNYQANPENKTYELLTYQISPEALTRLTGKGLSLIELRKFLALDILIPGFEIDDYAFEPFGYSLNAIKGKDYLTIHITPQADSSYVSFESSLNLVALAPRLLEVLAPNSFDLLTFNEQGFKEQIQQYIPGQYISQSLVSKTLGNGYHVCFANFVLPQECFTSPMELDINKENHTL